MRKFKLFAFTLVAREQIFNQGVEAAQKILFPTGDIFANYVVRGSRTFGINSGEVCMDYSREGQIK